MRTGECGKYQRAAVRTSLVDLHPGQSLISLADGRHIGEVKLRVHALHIHIHSQRNDVHISGTLSISEKRSFDTVSACQDSHLRVCHACSAVVVRMQGKNNVFTVFQVLAHILDLACIYVGHGKLHGTWKIDNRFPIRCGLPYIQNCVADLKGIFRFGSGKALRTVLKAVIFPRLLCQFLQKFCSLHGNLQDILLGFFENLLALCIGSGIINVNDRVLASAQSVKGFSDNMFSRLGQNLYRHIVRNQILLNQCPQKLIFCLGSSRKSNLNFFETDFHQHLEKFNLLLQIHRDYQRLISVAQIDAAPDRRFLHIFLLRPIHASDRRHVILSLILLGIHHVFLSSCFSKALKAGRYRSAGRTVKAEQLQNSLKILPGASVHPAERFCITENELSCDTKKAFRSHTFIEM